jgi:hypothetical protein
MLRVGLGQVGCPPEKRKVGSSILPLTTISGPVPSALNSTNANWTLSRLSPRSNHDWPYVTVVGRSLSHADRTSCHGAAGSRPLRPALATVLGRWLLSQLSESANGSSSGGCTGPPDVRQAGLPASASSRKSDNASRRSARILTTSSKNPPIDVFPQAPAGRYNFRQAPQGGVRGGHR